MWFYRGIRLHDHVTQVNEHSMRYGDMRGNARLVVAQGRIGTPNSKSDKYSCQKSFEVCIRKHTEP